MRTIIYLFLCLQCDQLFFGELVPRRPLGDIHMYADGRRTVGYRIMVVR